jgi:BMFP domain-containing protein YqiC
MSHTRKRSHSKRSVKSFPLTKKASAHLPRPKREHSVAPASPVANELFDVALEQFAIKMRPKTRSLSRSLTNFEENETTSPTVHKFITPRLEIGEVKLTIEKQDHIDAVDRLRTRIDHLESQLKSAKKAKKEERVRELRKKLGHDKFQLKTQLDALKRHGLTY